MNFEIVKYHIEGPTNQRVTVNYKVLFVSLRMRMRIQSFEMQPRTWWIAVIPDIVIRLISMSTLTLLSILITASPSLSLMLSWKTISSGNRTRLTPGWVLAKKLALLDMFQECQSLMGAMYHLTSQHRERDYIGQQSNNNSIKSLHWAVSTPLHWDLTACCPSPSASCVWTGRILAGGQFPEWLNAGRWRSGSRLAARLGTSPQSSAPAGLQQIKYFLIHWGVTGCEDVMTRLSNYQPK